MLGRHERSRDEKRRIVRLKTRQIAGGLTWTAVAPQPTVKDQRRLRDWLVTAVLKASFS